MRATSVDNARGLLYVFEMAPDRGGLTVVHVWQMQTNIFTVDFSVTLRVTNALGVAASRTHLEYVDTTIPESVCIALGAPLLLLRRRDR